MSNPEKITIKNVEAARDVIGGDSNNFGDTHNHNYAPTDFSELDGLIKAFQKDCEGDSKPKTLIEDLLHFSTPNLPKKLTSAGE